jgi:pyrimidine-specific ribonucleoside hydrolase
VSGAPIPVVLDVDTGVDDALALLFAARHPALDLRAVTCVAGNVDVDQVVANTLTVLAAAGRSDVPVARGMDRPLLEPARAARHVHGEDGLGDLALPPSQPPLRPDPRHAVELLRDVLLAARPGGGPKVTLLPLAPMTNIALLLRMHPEVAAGLERIVFMGGAAFTGNATAAAEFNVWHDPESVAVVLDAAAALGVPVTMYGLDVFYDVRVGRDRGRALAASADPAASLAGRLVGYQCDRFGVEQATIGDAGAVCAVVDPEGLTVEPLPVRIELAGTWTRGQTVVDRRLDRSTGGTDQEHDPHGLAATVVDVALAVDAARYADLWVDAVTGAGGVSAAGAPTAPTGGPSAG